MQLGQAIIDIAPLRASRPFRLVFLAQTISMVGTSLTTVTVNLQVFQLTGSSLQVGVAGLILGLSLMTGLLIGGPLADHADRRKILRATRLGVAVVLTALTVNAASPEPRLWVIYVATVLLGGIGGMGSPALMAATPALVGTRHLAAAGALTTMTTQLGAMGGPALAGAIAAGPGVAMSYALDATGFAISAVLVSLLPVLPPKERTGPQRPLHAIAEGMRFVRGNRLIGGLLLIDCCAMLFAMPYALFPELGTEYFGGGPATVGMLYTAPAAGAFLGALTSGWTGRVRRSGHALIAAVLVWGAAITGFGLSSHLGFALAFLALAGLGDTSSEILRRALLQHHTPHSLQGRVSGLWLAQATSGPALGNAASGLMARLAGPPAAAVIGGGVCIAGALAVAMALPELRRATLQTPTSDELATERVTSSTGG